MNVSSAEWASFIQLIQELIAGNLQRHSFSVTEMELMFDVEGARVRKSSRAELLRRYLRFVQLKQSQGVPSPPRFSEFFAQTGKRCAAANGGT